MNKEFLMWKRFLGIMAAALCVLNLTVGSAFSADLVKSPPRGWTSTKPS